MNTRTLISTENPQDPAGKAAPPPNNNRKRGGDRVPRPHPRGKTAAEPPPRRSTGPRVGGRAPNPTPPPHRHTKTRARKDTNRAPTPAAAATAAKPQTRTHPTARGGDKIPASTAPPQHRITRATTAEQTASTRLIVAGAAISSHGNTKMHRLASPGAATSSHGKARMHRIASAVPVGAKA